jgi:hypothetical protein
MTRERDHHETPPPDELDVLMARLVDGEGDDPDIARFELAAADDPALAGRLARRVRDDALLAAAVLPQVDELSRHALPEALARTRTARPLVAVAGWAAMLLVAALWWATSAGTSPPIGRVVDAPSDPSALTPEDHLQWYLSAPFVDEIPPTVLQVEDLGDGRYRLRYLRRFEEIGIYEGASPPVDESHHLSVHPASLARESEPEGPDS